MVSVPVMVFEQPGCRHLPMGLFCPVIIFSKIMNLIHARITRPDLAPLGAGSNVDDTQ